jgi:hypothetical protein
MPQRKPNCLQISVVLCHVAVLGAPAWAPTSEQLTRVDRAAGAYWNVSTGVGGCYCLGGSCSCRALCKILQNHNSISSPDNWQAHLIRHILQGYNIIL